MSAEQELRDYVKKYLGEDRVTVDIFTSIVSGEARLYSFSVSGNPSLNTSRIRIDEKLSRSCEWSKRDEGRLVKTVKEKIDTYVVRMERNNLRKSILEQVLQILNKHGLHAVSSHAGMDSVVILHDDRMVIPHGVQVLFRFTVKLDNSKIDIQYKFSKKTGPDGFSMELANPGSLDDGLVSFIKEIAIDEADRRLSCLEKEIVKIREAKAKLGDDMYKSMRYIMPGFKNE